jgi:hypothetical protein
MKKLILRLTNAKRRADVNVGYAPCTSNHVAFIMKSDELLLELMVLKNASN